MFLNGESANTLSNKKIKIKIDAINPKTFVMVK